MVVGNGSYLLVQSDSEMGLERLGQNERVEEPLERLWSCHWLSANAL